MTSDFKNEKLLRWVYILKSIICIKAQSKLKLHWPMLEDIYLYEDRRVLDAYFKLGRRTAGNSYIKVTEN